MDQAVTFVNDILDCMFWVTREGACAQRGRDFWDWGVFGLPVGWLKTLACCFDVGVPSPGVFGVVKSVQETSFDGILGDFGSACLTLMPLGSGLAHWWLGDILRFWILCVQPWQGCFFLGHPV